MALTGVVLLGAVLTACEEGALGTIETHNEKGAVETISNPPVDGCNRFNGGVTHVANHTVNDLILYTTADCTVPRGGESIYLSTQTSDDVVRSTGLWRSFTVVH
ncbi:MULTISPECIES: hypothetical protein [Streptomyces]|uniref:Uncharacterized protein n=1 Tax=Streptomyces cadmiisoli TaxID=2184053 RepID=A0A2Z4J8D2_9ACTN|nr:MULTISPECIES: hypothetical protein [Streptomyces]AWW41319.1 hypothetical protein DN051_35455 [Streptomyces cadmiisoli]KOV69537.1 hypothetical protein ADL00_11350 [Streptomyces sp. AS58]